LVTAALDEGARHIILGIGGSATNDGGAGCAQAIGVRFTDADGTVLPEGLSGGSLADVCAIDVADRDARLTDCDIHVACDVDNPLCGSSGASAIYGPQKGATPDMVESLDAGLSHLAELIERDIGRSVRELPGAGAAGGLGAGLVAFLGARLRPGIDIVTDTVRLAERIAGADLVITGEGQLDGQSMMGKVVHGVGRIARQLNIPVIAICGSIGPGADTSLELIDAYVSIVNRPMSLPDALANAPKLLRQTAANVIRIFAKPLTPARHQ
jgi:glycerate kinase